MAGNFVLHRRKVCFFHEISNHLKTHWRFSRELIEKLFINAAQTFVAYRTYLLRQKGLFASNFLYKKALHTNQVRTIKRREVLGLELCLPIYRFCSCTEILMQLNEAKYPRMRKINYPEIFVSHKENLSPLAFFCYTTLPYS